MLAKIKAVFMAFVIVLSLIIIFIQFNTISNQKKFIKMYQEKNDYTFVYLLEGTDSLMHLSNTLGQLNEVNSDSQILIADLLARAEKENKEWQQRLLQLIQHIDNEGNLVQNRFNINGTDYILFSKEQEELSSLAFESDVSKVLDSITDEYQNSNIIDLYSKKVIKNISKQFVLLDKEMEELQSTALEDEVLKKRFKETIQLYLLNLSEEIYNFQLYMKEKNENK